jgi:hypothetical protein
MDKNGITTSQLDDDAPEYPAGFDQDVSPDKRGTLGDQRDMFRMGKFQEMRV